MAATLVDRIWAEHVIARSPEGLDLIHIDRSLLTDLSGTIGLEDMVSEQRSVFDSSLHVAIPDHVVPTGTPSAPDRVRSREVERFVDGLETLSRQSGIRHFRRGSGRQGIVHVAALERAVTLPGATLVCGDSHTSTHGAVGALAWGIGSTEVKHVLATQTLWMRKPKLARITLAGRPAPGVYAKDVILWLIGRLGADYGREHVVEFAGSATRAMSVEARASICNLAVELGARFGIVAPDETAFDYLQGREFAPREALWDRAVAHWRTLRSDEDARFDKEEGFDLDVIEPQVTWGTSPEHVIGVGGRVPAAADPAALDYIGLSRNDAIADVPLDYVFIGSCANSRIEDLRVAASIVAGRPVAETVNAWVVPGSELVKRQAELEGLDRVFREAGFQWREPGCSMCVGINGDVVPPGKRCLSTSNRNFVGRQGPRARTHLASPATAAASALTGRITDPRPYLPAVRRAGATAGRSVLNTVPGATTPPTGPILSAPTDGRSAP